MANELDETKDPISTEGRDVNVIQKQVQVKKTTGDKVFEVVLWCLLIVPGLVFWFKKKKAESYLQAAQQKIQASASTIDNYMEQRVTILKNAAQLLNKSIDLDKEVLEKVTAYRGGVNPDADAARNEQAGNIAIVDRAINIAFENYPNIQSHSELQSCMQQNSYLQKEITAARDLYNDAVLEWNTRIFQWPVYKIVAANHEYTTRIPFTIPAAEKEEARGTFFDK